MRMAGLAAARPASRPDWTAAPAHRQQPQLALAHRPRRQTHVNRHRGVGELTPVQQAVQAGARHLFL